MTIDIIARAEARIAEIQDGINWLANERDEIEAFIRVHARLAEYSPPKPKSPPPGFGEFHDSEPQPAPAAAQMEPCPSGSVLKTGEVAPEASPAPHSENVPEQAQAGEAEADPATNTEREADEAADGESPSTQGSATAAPNAGGDNEVATHEHNDKAPGCRPVQGGQGADSVALGSDVEPVAPHSPETADETVGGFPVAAAPTNAEETGDGADRHHNRSDAERRAYQGVTGGESAAPYSNHEATGKSVGSSGSAAPRRTVPGSFASILRAYIEEHPDATTTEAAKALGVDNHKVSSTAAACKIPVRKLTEEEKREAKRAGGRATIAKRRAPKPAQDAPEPAPAPKAPPAPILPATVKPEPIAATPAPSRPLPVTNGPVRRPSGKLFWLRNPGTGEYLGRFCDRMVPDRREAWTGTEAQIFGCRRSFAIARELTEIPVAKEQPAARGTM